MICMIDVNLFHRQLMQIFFQYLMPTSTQDSLKCCMFMLNLLGYLSTPPLHCTSNTELNYLIFYLREKKREILVK